MSALAEALVAAQRRALSAMEKQYVAGKLAAKDAQGLMVAIGLTDDVDQDRLLAALEIIRQYGAPLPSESTPNGEPKKPELASDAQLALVARLLQEKQVPADDQPDRPLTKADAHTIIDTLKQGTYDAARWRIPF